VIFIDAIHVKIRDGQVANRPVYVALAVTCEGRRDILGLWAGDGGEGAKYWLHVLTELKNRGVADVLMVVCDGLTGLPDAITAVWEQTITQTCIVHLLRNSFRYAGRQHWDVIAKALKPVYTAATEAAARERLAEFAQEWGTPLSGDRAVVGQRLGRVRAVPGPRSGDPAGDLLDQRDRERQRPHPPSREGPRALPNEQAALKCVYMAIMSLDPTGTGRKRWTMRWNLPSTPSRSPSTAAGRK
jgi:putative transposase